jgi:hypothetical protein
MEAGAAGAPLIVTDVVALFVPQLFDIEYVIVHVPADTAVSKPEASIVATPVALLLQEPPLTLLLNVVVPDVHNVVVPVIAPGVAGNGEPVIVVVAAALPHALVTV